MQTFFSPFFSKLCFSPTFEQSAGGNKTKQKNTSEKFGAKSLADEQLRVSGLEASPLAEAHAEYFLFFFFFSQ